VQKYSKIMVLYSRLSKADLALGEDESYSIRNQKEFLEGCDKKITLKHFWFRYSFKICRFFSWYGSVLYFV